MTWNDSYMDNNDFFLILDECSFSIKSCFSGSFAFKLNLTLFTEKLKFLSTLGVWDSLCVRLFKSVCTCSNCSCGMICKRSMIGEQTSPYFIRPVYTTFFKIAYMLLLDHFLAFRGKCPLISSSRRISSTDFPAEKESKIEFTMGASFADQTK